MRFTKFLLLTIIAFGIFSCEKDGKNSSALSFHLHTMVGTTPAAYGVTFQTSEGRKFTLSDFRYYISNIELIKNDGDVVSLAGKVLLAGPSQHTYEIGDVPTGNYKGFRFVLGLDSITNHKDPTTYESDEPLAIQSPGIHWSWNSGYIFMKMEGQVDTTQAHSGTPNFDFFYHIGLDQMKRTIDFSTSGFKVTGDNENEIGLEIDFLKIMTSVDMRTESETHTFNNLPLATKIADNWQSAFSLE